MGVEQVKKMTSKMQTKAKKKLDKLGIDTGAIEIAAVGIHKEGANCNGVLYINTDGSIGFAGKMGMRRRNFYWAPGEVVNVFVAAKAMFAKVDIVSGGGHTVRIGNVEKHAADLFLAAFRGEA